MDIDKHKVMLNTLPTPELRERYAGLYGHTPTTRNKSCGQSKGMPWETYLRLQKTKP